MNTFLHDSCLLILLSSYGVQISAPFKTPTAPASIENLSRDPHDVKFFLLKNWEHQQEIILNNTTSLDNSGFKRGLKTFLLIDGFYSPDTPYYKLTTDAIRANSVTSDDNLIIVDYQKLSGKDSLLGETSLGLIFLYNNVLHNVDIVGERVAHFIHFLQLQGNLSLSEMHVIGMSLGCHVAGASGIFLKKLSHQKLGRITGLDPAATFYPLRLVKRLRSSDGVAEFIDVYHTNRGISGESYEDTADINVYVNGGQVQPGCEVYDSTLLLSLPGKCSHEFAWEFFAATFAHDIFACPCKGWDCYCQRRCPTCPNFDKNALKIGINISKSARGSYHARVTHPVPGVFFSEYSESSYAREQFNKWVHSFLSFIQFT